MTLAIRTAKSLVAALALAGIIAAAAFEPAALAGSYAPAGVSTPTRTARSSSGTMPFDTGLVVFITTRTVVPKARRTVHFTGYATYTFAVPKGRRIISASARIIGAEAHAVAFRRQAISHNHTRYSVSLVFPDEQGNPGKLTVRIDSIG
jgi:hypothetical protein